jgi:hypothetical protein
MFIPGMSRVAYPSLTISWIGDSVGLLDKLPAKPNAGAFELKLLEASS